MPILSGNMLKFFANFEAGELTLVGPPMLSKNASHFLVCANEVPKDVSDGI